MCTDEQWFQKAPTQTVMTSSFWAWPKRSVSIFKRKQDNSFWLTPLSVPPGEKGWYMRFPALSEACQSHMPAKLK